MGIPLCYNDVTICYMDNIIHYKIQYCLVENNMWTRQTHKERKTWQYHMAVPWVRRGNFWGWSGRAVATSGEEVGVQWQHLGMSGRAWPPTLSITDTYIVYHRHYIPVTTSGDEVGEQEGGKNTCGTTLGCKDSIFVSATSTDSVLQTLTVWLANMDTTRNMEVGFTWSDFV